MIRGGPRRAYRVWGFSSTHDAIAAEDALKSEGIAATTIPRPAELGGAECGIAVRVLDAETLRSEELFARIDILPRGSILMMDR